MDGTPLRDDATTIEQLKTQIGLFCTARDWDQYHSPKDLAIGAITEASELLEHFRFWNEEQSRAMLNDPVKREQISDEVADVFFFILRFAQMYGLDLTTEFQRKMAKNASKYPVATSRGSNLKYTEK